MQIQLESCVLDCKLLSLASLVRKSSFTPADTISLGRTQQSTKYITQQSERCILNIVINVSNINCDVINVSKINCVVINVSTITCFLIDVSKITCTSTLLQLRCDRFI